MPAFFSETELAIVAAAVERLIPADDAGAPGAIAADVPAYIDSFLGAFAFDPPRIFAGGPYSGRWGGEASFEKWLPLGPMEELAWRTRIEGSGGRAEREFNGPVVGSQQLYRDGLDTLGADFASVDGDEQDRRLDTIPAFKRALYEHACEGMYGDPVYGGNHDEVGWTAIGWLGDIQPRGYTKEEVESREKLEIRRG
jgi:gluconate 2-dehydrogenase gamma chain